MLGYTEDELLQKTFLQLTHPDDVRKSKEQSDALCRGDVSSYRLEKRYIRKDGEVLWGDLAVSAIRDEEGRHKATIGVIGDITTANAQRRLCGRVKRNTAR